jgi:hypothetical protein
MTADRSLIARLAARESWAKTADSSARTEPARRALLDRFERQVDPDGVLSPAERARRAGHARKAYFAWLALLSAQARRKTPAVGNEPAARTGPTRTSRSRQARPQSTRASSPVRTHRRSAVCRSEQRFRVSPPEDAGRTHAGPTEPGQRSTSADG